MEQKELWAVVRASSGELYLANIIGLVEVEERYSTVSKEAVILCVTRKGTLKVGPVYDYAVVLGPTPEGVLSKRTYVTPLGVTVSNPPAYIIAPSAIYFVEDMGAEDQELHAAYVKDVEESIKHVKENGGAQRATAAASPLALPNLPPGTSIADLTRALRGENRR